MLPVRLDKGHCRNCIKLERRRSKISKIVDMMFKVSNSVVRFFILLMLNMRRGDSTDLSNWTFQSTFSLHQMRFN